MLWLPKGKKEKLKLYESHPHNRYYDSDDEPKQIEKFLSQKKALTVIRKYDGGQKHPDDNGCGIHTAQRVIRKLKGKPKKIGLSPNRVADFHAFVHTYPNPKNNT